jgi:cytoskeletal protein CcmA (bactofilin family)
MQYSPYIGIDRIDIGVEAGTPRMVFEDAGNTIWEVDNLAGTFRWFTPGVVRMSLTTAGLTIANNLTVGGTLSGNIIHAEKDLTSSGTITILKNGFIRGTLSGNILHAEKSLTSSGTLTVVGNSNIRGTMSGKQLYITGTGANAAPLISTGNGRIGLGTNAPTSFLDVRGTIENGLVGWWPMDGITGTGTSVRDLSIGTNTGTLKNGATISTGRFGKAALLDGVNDYVNLASTVTINNDFTVSMWLKTNSETKFNSITSKKISSESVHFGITQVLEFQFSKYVFKSGDKVVWGNKIGTVPDVPSSQTQLCQGGARDPAALPVCAPRSSGTSA